MLSALRRFISDLSGNREEPADPAADERLAAAALLFHVVNIDGSVSDAEKARLRDVLMERFGLDEAATASLIAEARSADLEAVDLYGFTSILKARLDEQGRERIIAMMWEMVFADGAAHEFEDNVVWRAAELLGVSSRARIRLRKAARRLE